MERRERLPRLGELLGGYREGDARGPLLVAFACELAIILTCLAYLVA